MATAIICDRCGKMIPNLSDVKQRFLHKTYYCGAIIGLNNHDLFQSLERDIDLCDECNNSFIDWFNSGKKV